MELNIKTSKSKIIHTKKTEKLLLDTIGLNFISFIWHSTINKEKARQRIKIWIKDYYFAGIELPPYSDYFILMKALKTKTKYGFIYNKESHSYKADKI